MTDEEVKRLSRADLLKLLIIARKEIDRLNQENNNIAADMDRVNSKLTTVYCELSDARKILNSNFLFPDHGTQTTQDTPTRE